METREEHLRWAKGRALEYVNCGELRNALTSMMSDLGKHPETAGHAGIALTAMLMMGGHLTTSEDVRKHIEGFN